MVASCSWERTPSKSSGTKGSPAGARTLGARATPLKWAARAKSTAAIAICAWVGQRANGACTQTPWTHPPRRASSAVTPVVRCATDALAPFQIRRRPPATLTPALPPSHIVLPLPASTFQLLSLSLQARKCNDFRSVCPVVDAFAATNIKAIIFVAALAGACLLGSLLFVVSCPPRPCPT